MAVDPDDAGLATKDGACCAGVFFGVACGDNDEVRKGLGVRDAGLGEGEAEVGGDVGGINGVYARVCAGGIEETL